MGGIIIVFRPRDFINVGAVLKVKSTLLRPSLYSLLGPKYPLVGTIYPQLRVQGRSWYTVYTSGEPIDVEIFVSLVSGSTLPVKFA